MALTTFPQTPKVTITLGGNEFDALPPKAGDVADLYDKLERKEISQSRMSLEIIWLALSAANPEMTRGSFDTGFTVNMFNDLPAALEALGISKKNSQV